MMALSRFLDRGRNETQSDETALEERVKFPYLINRTLDLVMRIDEGLIRLGLSLPMGGTLVVVGQRAD